MKISHARKAVPKWVLAAQFEDDNIVYIQHWHSRPSNEEISKHEDDFCFGLGEFPIRFIITRLEETRPLTKEEKI